MESKDEKRWYVGSKGMMYLKLSMSVASNVAGGCCVINQRARLVGIRASSCHETMMHICVRPYD